jgi:hypothetical protein
MAVTNKYSEQFCLELYRKEHDLESDSLKVILMDTDFTFDPEAHATYGDISADEIAAGNGYLAKTKELANVAASIVSNEVQIDCDAVDWTASGGAIATTRAACIINDTHASDTVVCCLEFGVNYATATGQTFQISFANGLLSGVPNSGA